MRVYRKFYHSLAVISGGLTKDKLHKTILGICTWMNGSLDYFDAKHLSIQEIFKLNKIAKQINKESENTGNK